MVTIQGICFPLFRWIQLFCAAVMLLTLLAQATFPARPSTLQLVVESPTPGELQVYFDREQGFSEADSAKVALMPGRTTTVFELPPGRTRALRIDPSADMQELSIERISLRGSASQVSDDELFAGIRPVHEVESTTGADGSRRFRISDGALDPQLELSPAKPLDSSSAVHVKVLAGAWVLFAVALVLTLALQLGADGRYLRLTMVAWGLILSLACMAITSHSVSPDEGLHEADATYFSTRWSPPSLESAEMQSSYVASPYGVSYLAEWNITYLLAGKFGNVLDSLDVQPRTAYRLYQATLFGALIGLIVLLRLPQAVSVPLIVTPQLWYLFSYMNGDALPFAAAFLATALVCVPGSRVTSYISSDSPLDRRTFFHLALFMACFATLLVSKRNYWPIAAFVIVAAAIVPFKLNLRMVGAISTIMIVAIIGAAGGSALVETYGQVVAVVAAGVTAATGLIIAHGALLLLRQGDVKRPLLRYGLVFSGALLLASPWIVGDYMENGAGQAKQALVDQMREAHAAPEFKPSSNTLMPTLKLQSQGVPLHTLLSAPLDWHKTTFRSFFGGYGYMQFFAGPTYYQLVTVTAILLLFACVLSTLLLDPLGLRHLALAGAAALSLIGASLMHSWTYDFQAQGRYVIGILVLLTPFVFHLRASRRIAVVANTLLIALFGLSCYSFACIALPALTP